MFLKLDISKAFDSVSWSFLLEALSHLGFGPVWRNMISSLLRTASTHVLVNGQPGDVLRHQRGRPMAGRSFIPNAFYIGHGRSEQHVYRSLCSWSFATVVASEC